MINCRVKEKINHNGRTYLPGFRIRLSKNEAKKFAKQDKIKLPAGFKLPSPSETKPDGPKEYKCQYCGKAFDSPQGKAGHERWCKE
ncbi:MAG: hypothetical protein ACOCVB_00740 [Bacillota bacterium]